MFLSPEPARSIDLYLSSHDDQPDHRSTHFAQINPQSTPSESRKPSILMIPRKSRSWEIWTRTGFKVARWSIGVDCILDAAVAMIHSSMPCFMTHCWPVSAITLVEYILHPLAQSGQEHFSRILLGTDIGHLTRGLMGSPSTNLAK